MTLRIILIGAPGSGKGTQAKFLESHFGIKHLSTGDLLRETATADNALGRKIAELISKGNLIPDDLITELLFERISHEDCQKGFVLDGYPRTVPQAQTLVSAGIIKDGDVLLHFEVPDDVIVDRIVGRRSHPSSGRVYHVKYNPPKIEGKDDITGEDLIQRKDDTAEIVNSRLGVYHNQTAPVIEYYRTLAAFNVDGKSSYHVISGLGSIDEIKASILAALG